MIDLCCFKFHIYEKVGGLRETPKIALSVTVFIINLYSFFIFR